MGFVGIQRLPFVNHGHAIIRGRRNPAAGVVFSKSFNMSSSDSRATGGTTYRIASASLQAPSFTVTLRRQKFIDGIGMILDGAAGSGRVNDIGPMRRNDVSAKNSKQFVAAASAESPTTGEFP